MKRKGKMVEREIDSTFLNEKMIIKWYQPEAFTPMQDFHLCLMQDGDDYFRMGRIATLSDQLHEEAEIDPTVFVGIHYQDRYDRQDKYHPSGSKQAAYKHFLMDEVMPMLDRELQLTNSAISKAIMGDSLAGTLGLMTALIYPNSFDKVIMQSPYVDEQVFQTVESAQHLNQLAIYHTIGIQETNVLTTAGEQQDFISPNRQLHKLLQDKVLEYTYHELDGIHTWKYWQQDLPRALTTMFS